MGPAAVSGSRWWDLLEPQDRADIQAMVARGLGDLPHSRAVFVGFGSASAVGLRAWLRKLAKQVTSVANSDATITGAIQVALSAEAVGRLRPDALAAPGWDIAWRMGMAHPQRRRLLGDDLPDAWLGGARRWRGAYGTDELLSFHAHALLLLYAANPPALDALDAALPAMPADSSVGRLDTRLDAPSAQPGGKSVAREHFGFADGLSQPRHHLPGAQHPDPWHGCALGDLLLGQDDTYGSPCHGPLVPASAKGADQLCPCGPGLASLGRNGTYLVARQLYQDVPGFWRRMADRALELAALGQGPAALRDARALAEKLVGRTLDGAPLRPDGSGQVGDNDFGFAEHDPHGLGCPLGAHVRRANPRDAGARHKDKAASRAAALLAANNHRILRRGRVFGPWLDFERGKEVPEADGEERGLLFIALGADIERQFELVQQTWLLNPFFAGLGDEVDPLTGPAGPFSIQSQPVRARIGVNRFVQLIGGDYYFLPSLSALRFLATDP